jgi:hypothetical protein
MENISVHLLSISKIKNIVFDLLALLFIYLVPAISHLLSFPVYYLEPMRIMLILAIVHTTKKNSYLIALTLPIFSLLISTHPSLVKTSLITIELLLNVWLYFFISQKITNKFFSMFISILLSKLSYYLMKVFLVNTSIISGDVVATPIYIQILMLFVLSGYIYFLEFSVQKKQE